MNKLVEYIAGAIRFATEGTGLRDWSDFIILVNEYENDGKECILGMPVYVVPLMAIQYNFVLAYRWDIDRLRQKALLSVLEYQSIYTIEDGNSENKRSD